MEDVSITFSCSAFIVLSILVINYYYIYDNNIILHTFKFSETSIYLYI